MSRLARVLAWSPIALLIACSEPVPTSEASWYRNSAQTATNQPPVADFDYTVLGVAYCGPGACAYEFEFDAAPSYDPDGTIVQYQWFEGSSVVDRDSVFTSVYLRAAPGCGTGQEDGYLVVTDNLGATDSACFSFTDDNP